MLPSWLKSTALPFWSDVGFNAAGACFCERLDFRGKPIEDIPHRVMVQARQIYVFAHAALLGWFPEGASLAEAAMNSLLRDFRTAGPEGGFAFSITRAGTAVCETRDAYAQAFVLFALAWLHRMNGDHALLTAADGVIRFVDSTLTDRVYGGVFDAKPVTNMPRRQNPHMHLLEAYLALAEVAPDRGFLERASTIVDLLQTRFLHPKFGVVLEYFAPDWSAHADQTKAQIFEPGHHFEWIWLLRRYELLAGVKLDPIVAALESSARGVGLNRNGLIFDEVLADGTPHRRSSRLWPHTEAIKMGVRQHKAGRPAMKAFAAGMEHKLFDYFLDRPVPGTWIDHIDEAGKALVDYIPASSLYHILGAAAELQEAE